MKFKDRLQSLGFTSYDDYLAGDHWRDFKAAYRASGKPMRCAVCSNGRIQLHHHTYKRLGQELLNDVTPLCREHHEEVHRVLKDKGWFVENTDKAISIIRPKTAKPYIKPPPGEEWPFKKECRKCGASLAKWHFPNGGLACKRCAGPQHKKKKKAKNKRPQQQKCPSLRQKCVACKRKYATCHFAENRDTCNLCHSNPSRNVLAMCIKCGKNVPFHRLRCEVCKRCRKGRRKRIQNKPAKLSANEIVKLRRVTTNNYAAVLAMSIPRRPP